MHKLAVRHIRLWISVIASIGVFLLLPSDQSVISRLLVSWNVGVILLLLLLYFWMRKQSAKQICMLYIEEDTTAPVILGVVILAALLSMVAIVALLSSANQSSGHEKSFQIALSAVTVAASWTLVPTLFTTHYADMFYRAKPDSRPLHFPNTPMPVFWDFAYFSFTIAAACQTSDVSITHLGVRKAVIAHTVISFLFNAAILGFGINVTAGLLAGK